MPSEKKCIIFNNIDIEINTSEFERVVNKKPGSVKEKVKVAYLSNFLKSKGYMALIESAKEVGCDDYEFSLYGAFPSKESEDIVRSIVEKCKNVNIYDAILDRNKIKALLEETHIFALPTFYPNEAQPRSIIESLNYGIPVVVTQHASIPEMVNSSCAFFIDEQAPFEIAQRIKNILSNYKEMVISARERFVLNYSNTVIKNKLLNAVVPEIKHD